MNLKNVEKKENNTAELTVEITGAEFEAAINKVYNKVKGQIALPGFRKGKAPPQAGGEDVRHRRVL